MKKTISSLLLPAALLAAAPVHAQQAPVAEVFVIHGIPGADVGAPGALPVDVSVNGACALTNFQYGQIVGALHLAPGTYNIAIHLANAASPCGNAPVIGPAAIPFFAGENSTVIAHLTAAGAPTASKFVNNLSPTAANRNRVTVHHTANAPAVDAYFTTAFGNPLATAALATGVVNGEQATIPAPGPIAVQFALTPAGTQTAAFGPATLQLSASKAYMLYVVGSVARGTLNVIAKDVSELR
jgi:hypothetical protein